MKKYFVLTTAAAALAFMFTTPAQAAAPAADVMAIDTWDRHTVAFAFKWKPVKKTWKYAPQGNFFFLVKGAETDDVVTVQYYLGKKAFGPVLKCPVSIQKRKDIPHAFVSSYNCGPDLDKYGVSKPGKFTVKVGYRQLSRGKDHKDLATYHFDVNKHVGPGGTTEFHIDYDFRMGESWLQNTRGGTSFSIFSWFKESNDPKTGLSRGTFKLRCFVGDKKVEMDPLTNSRFKSEYDDYKHAKKNGGKQTKYRWKYNYFFAPGSARNFLKDNPGDYRCVMTRGGEVDREFYFTIADGKPVRLPCQTGATPLVATPPDVALIKTVFKTPQDAPFDRKAFAKGAFYGRAGVAKACGLQ